MIELIMVIVILGILAAIALPKFVDMSRDAERSVVANFVGSLHSGRVLAMGKAAVCGHSYGKPGQIHLATWVRIDGSEGNTPTCDGGSFSGHAISVGSLRSSLLANPNADIMLDNPNAGDQMRLVTRSGTTVNIVHDPVSGSITWTASPSY